MRVESQSDISAMDAKTTTVTEVAARKPGIVPKMWSAEEDALLRSAIAKHGEKSWKQVAKDVPGRTYIQCLQRWKKALKPGLRKGHWSEEEDEKLLDLINKFDPNLDWATIAKSIQGRSAKQCRERWFLNLDPSINHGPWSAEEDHALMEFVRLNGGKWSLIAKHMPGRTENSVKTRYYSLQRKEARRKKWTDDEDDAIIGHVLTYGRDFDSLDKTMKHRTKGQIKKRFTWLIQRQPSLLSQISSVEKQLRRKRRAPEPHQDGLLRSYSSSLMPMMKREDSDLSLGGLSALQVTDPFAATTSPTAQKKTHSMRKTVSQTVLQELIKPDQIMPLNNFLEYNIFNDYPEEPVKIPTRPRPCMKKANSLEILQSLLGQYGETSYSC